MSYAQYRPLAFSISSFVLAITITQMSLAYHLYSLFIPQAVRKYSDPLQQRFHVWKQERPYRKIKRELNTPNLCQERRNRLRELIGQGRPLKVAFQVAQLGKWKSESVLKLMLKDAHFEPFIWCVPVCGDMHRLNPSEYEREKEQIVAHFTARGIKVHTYLTIEHFPKEERPDLIFIHEAYDYIFFSENYKGLQQQLLCHVPYGFHNTHNAKSYEGIGNLCAVFDFFENAASIDYIHKHSLHRGRNCVLTGAPLADAFMEEEALRESVWKDCGKPMKKVIWAPHWTITPDICWFVSGTFLKNAEAMLELAEQYRHDIQFAFKPHPHLYRTLCDLPEWGKEKTDAYYRKWKEMPNTQLEDGAYTALFMQSDAMIHDCGSFILEYLFADKPCMFLRENEGYGDYNKQTIECLKAYSIGLSKEEIELFLQRSVLGSEDTLKEVRREMRRRHLLPPHGKSAAQNIIDAILGA